MSEIIDRAIGIYGSDAVLSAISAAESEGADCSARGILTRLNRERQRARRAKQAAARRESHADTVLHRRRTIIDTDVLALLASWCHVGRAHRTRHRVLVGVSRGPLRLGSVEIPVSSRVLIDRRGEGEVWMVEVVRTGDGRTRLHAWLARPLSPERTPGVLPQLVTAPDGTCDAATQDCDTTLMP